MYLWNNKRVYRDVLNRTSVKRVVVLSSKGRGLLSSTSLYTSEIGRGVGEYAVLKGKGEKVWQVEVRGGKEGWRLSQYSELLTNLSTSAQHLTCSPQTGHTKR